MSGRIRATLSLAAFLALTLPLMPLQWLAIKVGSRAQRRLPHWYHRQVCRLLGVRVHVHGSIRDDQAVLIVSNHVSWLDIPVLSAAAPVSFVAKTEVANWPLVGALARLQRTVFVDRGSRSSVAKTSNEMTTRLRAGDHVVLFAEGTSSDGNKVLPFKTALFAAASPPAAARTAQNGDADGAGRGRGNPTPAHMRADTTNSPIIYVQTAAIAYVSRHGLPLGRSGRQDIAWFGDEEMTSHAWALLQNGPIDVHITIGAPVPLHDFKDRKVLARHLERQVRDAVITLLRGRSPNDVIKAASPPKAWSQTQISRTNAGNNATWV